MRERIRTLFALLPLTPLHSTDRQWDIVYPVFHGTGFLNVAIKRVIQVWGHWGVANAVVDLYKKYHECWSQWWLQCCSGAVVQR